MSKTYASFYPQRAVLVVSGSDAASFLHGLLSCSVKDLEHGQGTWGALLTAQGKFLHDVFIIASQGIFLLEGEAERLDDLLARLKRFKLRSDVKLEIQLGFHVAVAWGDPLPGLPSEGGQAIPLPNYGGWAFKDPRHPAAGWRLLVATKEHTKTLTDQGLEMAPFQAWDAHRIALALPDGSRDMDVEDATLLEHGFAELGGVDFKKGCFVGQEVTARMRYRGLTKKRLMPVTISGALPAAGTILRTAEGQDAGEMRSSYLPPQTPEVGTAQAPHGLALIRLAFLDAGPLVADGATVTPTPTEWMVFPQDKTSS